jgi:hypothetical protein
VSNIIRDAVEHTHDSIPSSSILFQLQFRSSQLIPSFHTHRQMAERSMGISAITTESARSIFQYSMFVDSCVVHVRTATLFPCSDCVVSAECISTIIEKSSSLTHLNLRGMSKRVRAVRIVINTRACIGTRANGKCCNAIAKAQQIQVQCVLQYIALRDRVHIHPTCA